jgi:hypothetical protein
MDKTSDKIQAIETKAMDEVRGNVRGSGDVDDEKRTGSYAEVV